MAENKEYEKKICDNYHMSPWMRYVTTLIAIIVAINSRPGNDMLGLGVMANIIAPVLGFLATFVIVYTGYAAVSFFNKRFADILNA